MSEKRKKRMRGDTERAVYFRVGGLHVESNFQNLLAALNCSFVICHCSFVIVRHVRWDSGEWWAGSKPWKGRVNFGKQIWEKIPPERIKKESSGGSAQVLHLIARWVPVWIFRQIVPAANATNAGWSWPMMLKGSTSTCTATVLDTTSPKELNWTQFMIGTRATYTDCKDEREASTRLNSSGLCRSSR